MALPCWVSAPTPAATAAAQAQNVRWWLAAIAAAQHPACPLWNRAFRLASDVGPPLHLFGPHCDNGSLSPMDATLCDFYAPLLQPSPAVPLAYVPTLSLPAFVSYVLPRIPAANRLVLVTGLADWGPARVLGGGSEPAGRAACEALLGDARIAAWWAEMLDFGLEAGGGAAQGKRPHALPLGVDLHTLAFKPSDRPAWGPPQPPLRQAAALWAAAAAARHADPRVYVCWGIRNRRRLAVSEAAAAHPAVYAPDPAPPGSLLRTEFWARMGACAWAACVQGYGRDCHRTWEVLALGGGVVVEDMPFTRRCLAGFPAVFVGGAGGGAGEEGGRPPPRGTFSRPWQELGAALPTLAAARAAAAAAAAAPNARSWAGAAAPFAGPLMGALARELMAQPGASGGGEEEGGGAVEAHTLDPPAGLHPLLLVRPWLQAMRASAVL